MGPIFYRFCEVGKILRRRGTLLASRPLAVRKIPPILRRILEESRSNSRQKRLIRIRSFDKIPIFFLRDPSIFPIFFYTAPTSFVDSQSGPPRVFPVVQYSRVPMASTVAITTTNILKTLTFQPTLPSTTPQIWPPQIWRAHPARAVPMKPRSYTSFRSLGSFRLVLEVISLGVLVLCWLCGESMGPQ